jgi:hypothetical protein
MNSGERYLNVQYGSLTAEVDITGKSRLGGVQDVISKNLEKLFQSQLLLFNLLRTWMILLLKRHLNITRN